jgi:hypothetical protein
LIKLLTLKYKKESMAQSEDIRIIWKTNCKWRDTDYYVNQEDVRPIGSCKDKIKEGDAVKMKYGSRWYNAEIVEITTTTTTTTTNEGTVAWLPLLT